MHKDNMKSWVMISLILLSLMFVIGASGCGTSQSGLLGNQSTGAEILKNNTAASNSIPNLYSIHGLKQKNLTSGNFSVEGWVVKIYTCPVCPEGASCKPCMKDNIVISESDKLLGAYALTEKEMIVFSSNPGQFELGKKYRFSIKISDYRSTGEPINDIELVGYDATA